MAVLAKLISLQKTRDYLPKLQRSLLTMVSIFLASASPLAAGKTVLSLVDQNGTPIPNAVIAVASENFEMPAKAARMDQVNRQFSPHVLVVAAGQDVLFPNSDDIRHHVYSFSRPNDFEIKLYSGEPSEPVRFAQSGIVVLGCNIHDQMKGYLYVTEDEQASVTDDNGVAELDLDDIKVVRVWHSRLSASGVETKQLTLDKQDAQGNWMLQVELQAKPVLKQKSFRDRYK